MGIWYIKDADELPAGVTEYEHSSLRSLLAIRATSDSYMLWQQSTVNTTIMEGHLNFLGGDNAW